MSFPCALVGLLSLPVPGAWPAAPAEEGPARPRASVIGNSFGVFVSDGELGAAGPGYKARFAGGGVEFTPALGERAPRDYPVFFALESVRRGDRAILENPPVPSADRLGNSVRFARGAGIVESYEARVDGVEQAFHFESHPEGTGDLVVRGRVTTELPASSAEGEAEGIRFEMRGLGGVTWGPVTGIDAEGSKAGGFLRFDGTHLEMALPGEFVDRATYPLLLDPLIGPTLVFGGGNNDRDPDVAYDAANDIYLVVWERTISSSNRDILGQRFLSGGTLVGPTISIATNGDTTDPAVANVNATDRFLVVYDVVDNIGPSPHPRYVRARAVNAFDGVTSGEVTIQYLGLIISEPSTPDVGGHNAGFLFNHIAIVVWKAAAGIRAMRVLVPLTGVPTLGTVLSVSSDAGDLAPAITKHGGGAGRFLVVWERPTANGNKDVHARAIDTFPTLVTPVVTVSANLVADEANPDCATKDGTNFAIVYERRSLGPSGDSDVACRTATYLSGPGTLSVSSQTILAGGTSTNQVDPAIDFAAFKYLVAWSYFSFLSGTGYNVLMMGLDPGGCVPCDPAVSLDFSSTADRGSEIAAKYGGSASAGDQAVVVWESWNSGLATGDVKAQRVEAIGSGGPVTSLGGGCGGGGTAGVSGPVALGNSNFAFTLSGAGGPPVNLVLGTSLLNLPCGPCTLKPTLDFLLPGSLPLALPIPCDLSLLGATLYAQWIVLASGGCSLVPGVSLSSAVSAVIGL